MSQRRCLALLHVRALIISHCLAHFVTLIDTIRVKLKSKRSGTTRTFDAHYLSLRSWAENLLLTPAYAHHVRPFAHVVDTYWKATLLQHFQDRAWGICRTIVWIYAHVTDQGFMHHLTTPDGEFYRDLCYPRVFMSKDGQMLWILRNDLGRLRGTDDGSLWDWNPPSKDFRARITRLEKRKTDRHKAAFEPAPRALICWWPTRADMRAETKMQKVWVDLEHLSSWRLCRVDITLGGTMYHNRPVTDAHP